MSIMLAVAGCIAASGDDGERDSQLADAMAENDQLRQQLSALNSGQGEEGVE